MTTPTWITGFEYGLATPNANGGGLLDAIVGGCTIVPSSASIIPHTGSYVLKCTAVATAMAYISRNMTAGTTCVVRYYMYLYTVPATDKILFSLTTVGHKIQISYKQSDGKLYLGIDGGLTTAGPVVTSLNWYCIDVKAVTSANPWLTDWQVDSLAQTQNSYAHASENMSVIDYGIRTNGVQTVYYDDIVHSVTAADYPIGPGGTYGLIPNADGVHNNAANVMEDSAGNDIDGVNYFAWSKLDDMPWTTTVGTDRVQQTNVGAVNYCEINFADLLEAMQTIIGVDALLEYAASNTNADKGGCMIYDGISGYTLYGSPLARADYSETSAYFKHAAVAVTKTYAAVNAVKCRFGYSDDVDGIPYWLAIMLEVGYSFPANSILMTNSAIDVEKKLTQGDVIMSNAAVNIEEKIKTNEIRMTNAAIMIEIKADVADFGPLIWMP